MAAAFDDKSKGFQDEASRREEKKMRAYATRRAIMDIGMGLIYLGVGVFFAFSAQLGMEIVFPSPFSYIFGGICIVYGGFRIYRGFRKNYFKE